MNPTPQRTLRWTMTWQRRIEQTNNGDPDRRYLAIVIHETWTLSWVDEGAVGEASLATQKSISGSLGTQDVRPAGGLLGASRS